MRSDDDHVSADFIRIFENLRGRMARPHDNLGRLGKPGELGPILVYLASDASDYMTGETILMDGGWVVS